MIFLTYMKKDVVEQLAEELGKIAIVRKALIQSFERTLNDFDFPEDLKAHMRGHFLGHIQSALKSNLDPKNLVVLERIDNSISSKN